jgi:hypothetical protein
MRRTPPVLNGRLLSKVEMDQVGATLSKQDPTMQASQRIF